MKYIKLKGEILIMKQETTQKTKLHVFLDKVEDFYERYKILIFIILYLVSTSVSAIVLYSMEGYKTIPYPEEAYQQLEGQELPNLVKNESIQPENLSEDIIYSVKYATSSNQDTNCTIILEKENAKITVTGNELNVKNLTIEREKNNQEDYDKFNKVSSIAFTFVGGVVLVITIWAIFAIICLVLEIIVLIQKEFLKRKQKK